MSEREHEELSDEQLEQVVGGSPGLIIAGNGQDTVVWNDPTGQAPPPLVIDGTGELHNNQ